MSVHRIHPDRQALDVYPGTHRPLGSYTPQLVGNFCGWDESPIYKHLDGALREFFGIGHLADALNRSPKTLYKWEEKGFLPRATFLYNAESRNGQRRLYTRRQIEGTVQIAIDEGVISGTSRYIGTTLFPQRCAELFAATRRILPPPVTIGEGHA